MVQSHKVVVYLAVTNHKIAKTVIPQILKQSGADSVVLLVGSDDAYVKGVIHSTTFEHDGKFVVEYLKNKNLESSLSEYFRGVVPDKQDVCIFIGDKVCFIAPDFVENLANFTINNPDLDMSHPACINTERTTYIYQVMGHYDPKLLWRWDTSYLDEFEFKNTKASFHIALHEEFLSKATDSGLSQYSFSKYFLNRNEMTPYHGFAMTGDNLAQHFKSKTNIFNSSGKSYISAICGRSLCSWLSSATHKSEIDKTDILLKYQKFGQDLYDSNSKNKITETDSISEFDIGLSPGAMFPSQPDTFNVKIAISSHVSTQNKTLPILLDSLVDANVPSENILVVIGGSDSEKIEKKHGVIHSYVTHNSFDHNATIDIVEKGWGGDWWFVMHDTTKAGKAFYQRLNKIGAKAEHVAALKDGWLNMGLFSRKSLKDMGDYILQLKNCNKMQAILSEKMFTRMTEYDFYDIVEQIDFPFYGDIYGDGVDRQVMHLTNIDLYKFQSFHYHSDSVRKLIDSWLVT